LVQFKIRLAGVCVIRRRNRSSVGFHPIEQVGDRRFSGK